ncbi:DoxX family protein [Chengkuizengella axinellae]|uniref:DoxX family protein n=1 Tax=Chengkuizengella axinellae TaxID=3064388 RepID=A0ABT9J6K3_9BACL|nr:DoxX family protein [Chengkuizengella sp. 2205SS18-9]MDP5276584.1 DoxX family protein [Chengkuizengella sp. 2205SS18-9]
MKWIQRIVQVLLAAAITPSGVSKVTGGAAQMAESLGYSPGFLVFIGICEILGGIGLIVGFWKPKLALLASGGLAVIMAGAVFTHLSLGQGFGAAMPSFVFLILSVIVLIGKIKALRA